METEHLIKACRHWAGRVRTELDAQGVFLFGSAVNEDGEMFDESSDVDLVIVMPSACESAASRVEWISRLRDLAARLELSLLTVLKRKDASKPITSMVALDLDELKRGLHKSGVRSFYNGNEFLDLSSDSSTPRPLLAEQPAEPPVWLLGASKYAQTIRNKFLSCSPNHTRTLGVWGDSRDPLPKPAMRLAATLAQDEEGASITPDTHVGRGLEFLSAWLYRNSERSPLHRDFHKLLSVRRKARGVRRDLLPEHQLFLGELLVDIARAPRVSQPEVGDYADSAMPAERVRINGYAQRYFRNMAKLTVAALSDRSGIPIEKLKLFESLPRPKGVLEVSVFKACLQSEVDTLERVLDCVGKLRAGTPDDFLAIYTLEAPRRGVKRSTASPRRSSTRTPPDTKVVVFDFDGTLTIPHGDRTTWEELWVASGGTVDECAALHARFSRKEFSHQEWCNITAAKFRERGLARRHVLSVAHRIKLVRGISETICTLREAYIRLFILSGSIKLVIQEALGAHQSDFEEIRANEMLFATDDIVSRIEGTPFDFEGKAKFLERVIKEHRLAPMEVLYVGNSRNDIYAGRSGARTLCINPKLTDPDDPNHWTSSVGADRPLTAILDHVYSSAAPLSSAGGALNGGSKPQA